MMFPKSKPVRSEAYRKAVAGLPCWLCTRHGHSQAAHGDAGKGMGMKACDLTCYPACGPNGGTAGCHYLIGSTGNFTREERRELERKAAAETQQRLIRMAEYDAKLRRVLVKVGLIEEETA
jgi:hypothetical protein